MPDDRDRDKDKEEDLDDEEETSEDDDEEEASEDDDDEEETSEDDDEEEASEDDDEVDDEDDDEEDEEERLERERQERRRRAARKKRAERRKASAEVEEEPPRRSKKRRAAADEEAPRKSAKRRKAAASSGRRGSSSERRRRRTEEEEPPRRAAAKRKGAPKRRRATKERKEVDFSLEIVEPERPPEANIDLGGELEPTWEPGVLVGGGLGLGGVAFAVVSLMTSGGQVSTVSVIGLVILLMAIASGGIGVLARKSWGYILGLGASGLGVVAGLLWALYAVVDTSDVSPLWPLFFFLCNLGSVIGLFQMRWGPGLMADERDRLRSLKLRTSNHTTVSGELALAGSIAAVLGSVLCGLMLMGAASGTARPSSAAARFVDGMDLQAFTEAPEIGSLVLARWGNEDYFFLGRVEQARGGDEFHVVYLDGDRAWVRMQDLRQDTIRDGASVHIHVQGQDGWLPAVVTQRSGNRVEADVGSQRVWVQLGMVRVREAS